MNIRMSGSLPSRDREKLMNVALELIGEGYKLSREISKDTKLCAVLAGHDVDHLVEELYAYGADCVYVLQNELLAQYTTDAYAKVITDAIHQYKPEIVLFGATYMAEISHRELLQG